MLLFVLNVALLGLGSMLAEETNDNETSVFKTEFTWEKLLLCRDDDQNMFIEVYNPENDRTRNTSVDWDCGGLSASTNPCNWESESMVSKGLTNYLYVSAIDASTVAGADDILGTATLDLTYFLLETNIELDTDYQLNMTIYDTEYYCNMVLKYTVHFVSAEADVSTTVMSTTDVTTEVTTTVRKTEFTWVKLMLCRDDDKDMYLSVYNAENDETKTTSVDEDCGGTGATNPCHWASDSMTWNGLTTYLYVSAIDESSTSGGDPILGTSILDLADFLMSTDIELDTDYQSNMTIYDTEEYCYMALKFEVRFLSAAPGKALSLLLHNVVALLLFFAF